jgi:hypothetical protein
MARNNRKKSLAIVAVGAVAAGALGVGVAAQFTESASTGVNSITAATGKMTLGGDINTGVIVTDVVPGDTVTRTLTVNNSVDTTGLGYTWEKATISLDYRASAAGSNNNGIAPTKFEEGANPLTVAILDLGADGALGGGDDQSVSGTSVVGDQAAVNIMRNATDRWIPGTTRTYQVALTFPTAANNGYEGASAEFVYTVNATQRGGNEAGAFDGNGDFANGTTQVENYNASAAVI